MAIFNQYDKRPSHSSNIATIAAGVQFTGKAEVECVLHIDGEFHGDVNSTNTVEIGKLGLFKGELRSQKLVIAGRFFGNADCEAIEILAGGEVEGSLVTASLAVDSESTFQGDSAIKKPEGASRGATQTTEPKNKPKNVERNNANSSIV